MRWHGHLARESWRKCSTFRSSTWARYMFSAVVGERKRGGCARFLTRRNLECGGLPPLWIARACPRSWNRTMNESPHITYRRATASLNSDRVNVRDDFDLSRGGLPTFPESRARPRNQGSAIQSEGKPSHSKCRASVRNNTPRLNR